MENNRDRLQAHRFVVGRLVNAVVVAEPDTAVAPLRRATRGWFIGLLVAVLVMAGFAVYGLIRGKRHPPVEPDPRSGTVIVDGQTGTRYVLRAGRLHPVLNLTSALLAAGADRSAGDGRRPEVVKISATKLSAYPRGDYIGIPGAPDVLPDPGKLATDSWLVCQTAHGRAGKEKVGTTLNLGGKADFRGLDDGEAAVVKVPGGTRYLIWQGSRFVISSESVAVALGLGNVRPIPVQQRWVNLFPAGERLGAPSIAGKGRPGGIVAGRPGLVGQVFQARTLNDAVNYYVLLSDGMQPVTVTMASILAADPDNAGLYKDRRGPIEVSAADIATVPMAGSTLMDGGLPATPPKMALSAGDDVVPCAQIVPRPDGAGRVLLGSVPLDADQRDAPDKQDGPDKPDHINIEVEPGGGALVSVLSDKRTKQSNNSTEQSDKPTKRRTLYLITEQGRRYRIGTPRMEEQNIGEVAKTLGYDQAAIQLPQSVLDLFPEGPALDPASAGKQAVSKGPR